MFQLLYDPVSEIRKARKQSYAKILMYLLTASLFETIGVLFIAWRYFRDALTTNTLVNGIFGLLFALIAAHLIIAFFFSVVMHVLDGKGGYYDGLATVVLAMVAPAIMLFFAGAVLFIPFGVVIASLLLAYGCVLGIATLFRAGKELFELDYAGVLVGFLATSIPLALSVCAIKLLL
jgi:hypothetical protein